MPAVILPAIIAGALGGITVTAGVIGFSFIAAAIAFAGSLVLGVLARALSPKPQSSGASSLADASSLTQNVRQPITPHKHIYGQCRVGGPYAYIGSTDGNSFLHIVIILAAHQVASIDEIWVNDVVVPSDALDSGGSVISGQYSGFLRIKKHLGAPNQIADADLVAEVSEWTNNHRLQGRAYIYVRLKYSQDIWPGGIPNFSAVVRGKLLVDPRDGITRFSSNVALFCADYKAAKNYGFGNLPANTDDDNTSAQANIADEIVDTEELSVAVTAVDAATNIFTLDGDHTPFQMGDRLSIASDGAVPGGLSDATDYYAIIYQFKDTVRVMLAASLADALAGNAVDISDAGSGAITLTRTGEPRYHGAGVLDTSATLANNYQDMLRSMGGRGIYAGGAWRMLAAAYATPTLSFREGDLVGGMNVQTKLSMRDRFNQVKGSFISSINDFQPSDYPLVQSQTFIDQDAGLQIPFTLDLPYTNRVLTAQRLAKVELLRSRQEIVFSSRMNLKGMRFQCGDNINFTSARYGWSDKPFECTNWKLGADAGNDGKSPVLYVELTLRETAEEIFDWDSIEGDDIDPAPNSNLPNAFSVDAPSGLSFTSRAVLSSGGDTVYNLVLGWDLSTNAYVVNDGRYEIQYKKSSDTDWRPHPNIPGDSTFADIATVDVNEPYDIRIRAVNNLGVRSPFHSLLGAYIGSSGPIGTTNDWQTFSDSVGSSEDFGSFTDSVGATDDWGHFTA